LLTDDYSAKVSGYRLKEVLKLVNVYVQTDCPEATRRRLTQHERNSISAIISITQKKLPTQLITCSLNTAKATM
jgi:hypothetical protein